MVCNKLNCNSFIKVDTSFSHSAYKIQYFKTWNVSLSLKSGNIAQMKMIIKRSGIKSKLK